MKSIPPPGAGPRVLVVDDEAPIRRLVRVIISRMGNATVVEAETAEGGMTALEQSPFDLIITDYRMPGKTGVDLLEFAVRKRPDARRLLITAFDQMEIGVEAVNRGHVDGFLRKPWENARFVTLVKTLVATPRSELSPPGSPGVPAGTKPAGGVASLTKTASSPERQRVEADIARISRNLQQLRVRLGLGTISPEGYEKLVRQLTEERARLEARMLS